MMQLMEREVLQLKYATQHLVTYILQRCIEKFGNKDHQATLSELNQLHSTSRKSLNQSAIRPYLVESR